MSQQLISRSHDLRRLRDEGYDLSIQHGYLVVRDVPYATRAALVERGVLVDPLALSGDVTAKPGSHTVMFAGEMPCDSEGRPLVHVVNSSQHKKLAEGLVIDHTFSRKPVGGYADYYEKMTTYIAILSAHAEMIDRTATARTFPVVETSADESVFRYTDTASSRASINPVTERLTGHRVAIVGMGGTGAYTLDLVAKTPVGEIHAFDGDVFLQHNAFRGPGAPSVEDLREKPNKSVYWAARYSEMHRHIIPHAYHVDESNVDELVEMDFVFLSVDSGEAKEILLKRLTDAGVSFIDSGIGVYEVDGALAGSVRITTATDRQHDHVWKRVSIFESGTDDEYSRNIQIADLNALAAALAVSRWKRLLGFYNDLEAEYHSVFTIDGNHIDNEEQL